MTKSTKFPPIILILFAVLLWSTGGLFIKMTTIDAFAVNAGRSFLAALTVAAFTYKKGLRLDKFTLLTAFLYAGTLSCFVYANKSTTAANAIFLQYTAPIYILILSPFVLKEKFHFSDLITVVICLAGMSLFFFEEQGSGNLLASNIFVGNIAALASGVFFGLYFIFLRHPRSLSNRNPALSVFYGNILVVVFMIPFLIQNPPEPSSNDLLAIVFLGVFQIGTAYILFTKGISEGVRSLDASIIGYVEPLLNPVWVFLFIGERPNKWAIIGGAIIIGAVVFHTLKQNRSRIRSRQEKML
ncbi:MAG: superfamily drug/metabolite permease [Acidobacteria bacterium]|jgi:DME family drug/metabolite transporter|nr:superfamily drug/metabolite permease [Acidobacteriota bacterium]